MNTGYDVRSDQPAPGAGVPGLALGVPPRRTARRTIAIAAAGASAAVLAAAAVILILADNKDSSGPSTPSVPGPQPVSAAERQAAAQERTCGVLRNGYESVAAAIDERNKYSQSPWTDPALLTASGNVASTTERLANDLDTSLLAGDTPPVLRSAVVNYVAALRATSVSEQGHASDKQLNGIAMYYNRVVDAPLNICGIRG